MSASFLLAKQREGKDPSKAAVGDEGVSPATILWDPPPPSPAFLPSATMSSGHEAMSKADRLTLNESEQPSSTNAGATSSTPRALGVVLAAVVLAAALISSALREPSAPPLPRSPHSRSPRRCRHRACACAPAPQSTSDRRCSASDSRFLDDGERVCDEQIPPAARLPLPNHLI